MRAYIFAILMVCAIIAAGIVVYMRTPAPETVSEDRAVHTESPETAKAETQLSEKPTQQENASDATEDNADNVKPDWLDGPKPDEVSKRPADLWKDFEVTDVLSDEAVDITEYDIENPESYDLLRKEMVKKYGETLEVENYMQTWLKSVSDPDNIEYQAEWATAIYAIFPDPQTRKSMEVLNALVNDDTETLEKYAEPAESNSQFMDVQKFFENTDNYVEAFRRLRKFNPERSAEFEKFILDEARKDDHIDLEEVRSYIEASYKTEVPETK
jgi:hypothetical protein